MEPVALSLAVALFIIALLRMPGVFSPALAAEGESRWPGVPAPGDEDEELPQTDRAPSRPLLGWSVAAVAVVRVVLFATLHT